MGFNQNLAKLRQHSINQRMTCMVETDKEAPNARALMNLSKKTMPAFKIINLYAGLIVLWLKGIFVGHDKALYLGGRQNLQLTRCKLILGFFFGKMLNLLTVYRLWNMQTGISFRFLAEC